MAGNRSFKDYVADRFYNELFAAIQSYTAENYQDLDLRLYRVRTIGGIELSDIEVKFVSINDLPDMKIEFDVAVEAELEARESDYHYDESETCKQWFMLSPLTLPVGMGVVFSCLTWRSSGIMSGVCRE